MLPFFLIRGSRLFSQAFFSFKAGTTSSLALPCSRSAAAVCFSSRRCLLCVQTTTATRLCPPLLAFSGKFYKRSSSDFDPMSGSIKGSLENVVKGKLVLKGGKGVGGGASASASLSKTAGVSKEVSEAPKQQSSSPKVFDTRTPYEKVQPARCSKIVGIVTV